jgi:hypothetical protein
MPNRVIDEPFFISATEAKLGALAMVLLWKNIMYLALDLTSLVKINYFIPHSGILNSKLRRDESAVGYRGEPSAPKVSVLQHNTYILVRLAACNGTRDNNL